MDEDYHKVKGWWDRLSERDKESMSKNDGTGETIASCKNCLVFFHPLTSKLDV